MDLSVRTNPMSDSSGLTGSEPRIDRRP
jgi:hypothetical protein